MKKVLRLILVLLFFVSIFYCKAEEKPVYLIIVPQKEDRKMVEQYVGERQDEFDVIVTSLKENNKPVTAKSLQSLIRGYYATYNKRLKYVVWVDNKDSKIIFGTVVLKSLYGKDYEIKSELYFSDTNDDCIPDIGFSRLKYGFFNKQWSTEASNEISIIMPQAFYTRQYGAGQCARFHYGVDMSQVGYEIEQTMKLKLSNAKINTLYEQRGSKTKGGDTKSGRLPTMPLTRDNAKIAIDKSGVIIGSNTYEIYIPDWNKYNATGQIHHELKTSFFIDEDKDLKVDLNSTEIHLETIYNGSEDEFSNLKRLGLFPISNIDDKNINFYNFINRIENENLNWYLQESMLTPSNSSFFKIILDSLYRGETISEAVNKLRVQFIKEFPNSPTDNLLDLNCVTIAIYGPPESTLSDFITDAKLEFLPNLEEPVLIPIGRDRSEFIIKNKGNSEIQFNFMKNEFIDIRPEKGTMIKGESLRVELTIKAKNALRSSQLPQRKRTVIDLKSNAGSFQISVIWYE